MCIRDRPWASFEGFHLHLPRGNDYLLPIFTMGKLFAREGKTWLPLALQAVSYTHLVEGVIG